MCTILLHDCNVEGVKRCVKRGVNRTTEKSNIACKRILGISPVTIKTNANKL